MKALVLRAVCCPAPHAAALVLCVPFLVGGGADGGGADGDAGLDPKFEAVLRSLALPVGAAETMRATFDPSKKRQLVAMYGGTCGTPPPPPARMPPPLKQAAVKVAAQAQTQSDSLASQKR